LLFCAAASIALAPRQRRGWQNGKAARHVTVRCSVEGFDTGSLPGVTSLPVCYTQGSASASSPAAFPLPAAEAAATPATAKALTQQHTLREPGLLLPAAAAMDVSKTPLRHGLSCARPALRVGAARRTTRPTIRVGTAHRAYHRASSSGRTRSARRAVGARLQPNHEPPVVPQAAWDPTCVRTQLQVGFQVIRRNKQPRRLQQLSTCSGVVELSRVLPLSLLNLHDSKS